MTEKEKLIKRTNEIIDQGKKSHDQWKQVYSEALRYALGDQTANKDRDGGWQKINLNKIYPAIMQQIAMAANRDTDIKAIPYTGKDYGGSDVWMGHVQWLYEKGVDFDKIRREAIVSGSFFGNYVLHPFWNRKHRWDDKAKQWVGNLEVRVERPDAVVVDPNLRSEHIEDAEYIYIVKNKSLRDAIREFPRFEKELREEADNAKTSKGGQLLGKLGGWFEDFQSMLIGNSPKDTGPKESHQLLLDAMAGATDNNDGLTDKKSPKYVTVYEMYLKDDATIKRKEEEDIPIEEFPEGSYTEVDGVFKIADPEAFKALGVEKAREGQVLDEKNWPTRILREWEEPKFPYGRLIIKCGENIILNDKEKDQRIPYESGWPLIYQQHLPLPFSPKGMNGVEMGRHLQDWLNALASGVTGHALGTSFPSWFVEPGALMDDPDNMNPEKYLKPGPGNVTRLSSGAINQGKVQMNSPASMQQTPVQMFGIIEGLLNDTLNMQNVMKGKASSGEQTGTELSILSRNAAQQLNLSSRLLDKATVKLIDKCVEILKYHHKPGDVVKVHGDRFIEEVQDPETGETFTINQKKVELTEEHFEADFDVEMEIVEHSPFSREERKQDATALLQATEGMSPTIFRKFLRAYGVIEIDQVMDEWKQKMQAQAEAAEAEMQAEQAQEPPKGE